MRKRIYTFLLIGFTTFLFFTLSDSFAQFFNRDPAVRVLMRVQPQAFDPDVKRIGLNLGTWTSWGAEQLMNNILMNPGFEKKVDRIAVIVSASSAKTFSDERGLGEKDDYWKGADYDIRTGPAAGTRGKIIHSQEKGDNGLPTYTVDGALPHLEKQTVIILTKEDTDEQQIGCWWIPNYAKGRVLADPNEHRPGSAGVQSVRLLPAFMRLIDIHYYLDAIGERAGKLLLIDGKWTFSIWAKGSDERNALIVAFERLNGSKPFLREHIPLTNEWKEYVLEFEGNDNGTAELLKLSIAAEGPDSSEVWIDDVYLGKEKKNPTDYRDEVIAGLQELKPGFLRDHQGQIGDYMPNRIADTYARGSFKYRFAKNAQDWWFGYSISQLFDLCEYVGAIPWTIVPDGMSDEECKELGEFLAEHATKERFKEIYLEFGNENWNWIFRPAQLPYPKLAGLVSDRVFSLIKKYAGDRVNIKAIIQGQYANPDQALAFGFNSKKADVLAVAPYFLFDIDETSGDFEKLEKVFADDDVPMKYLSEKTRNVMKKQFAFYEVNLHTTQGNALSFQRNAVAAGMVSGPGLARRLMQGMFNYASPMAVFVYPGFDAQVRDFDEWVRLWGVIRDLSPTNRLRPTGLAVSMMNEVLGGSLHEVKVDASVEKKLTAAATKKEGAWHLIIVSAHDRPIDVEVAFPDDEGAIPRYMRFLDASTPFDTNEESDQVKIETLPIEVVRRIAKVKVPAWGLVTLLPKNSAAELKGKN